MAVGQPYGALLWGTALGLRGHYGAGLWGSAMGHSYGAEGALWGTAMGQPYGAVLWGRGAAQVEMWGSGGSRCGAAPQPHSPTSPPQWQSLSGDSGDSGV